MSGSDVFGVFAIGFLVGVIAGGAIFTAVDYATGRTYADGQCAVRMEALEAGVAEWPRNGDFKWKEMPQ